MKHTIYRILALLLALALALSLAACSKEDGEDKEGSGTKDGVEDGGNGGGSDLLGNTPEEKLDPTKEPQKYLDIAGGNLADALAERYSGSPLAALAKTIDTKGTILVNGSVDSEGTTIDIDASLGYDIDAGLALLNATASAQGQTLEAGAYISPEFWGVSVPFLFGDYTFYGLRPYGLYDQVSSSVLGQAMDPESMESFRELDQVIDTVKQLGGSFGDTDARAQQYRDDIAKIFDGIELTVQEDKVTVDGAETDGYTFTGVMDSDDLADLVDVIVSSVYDPELISTLEQLSAAVGEDIDASTSLEEMQELVEEIRASGASCEYKLHAADECVVGVTITPIGENVEPGSVIEISFFDSGSITFALTSEGETGTLKSTVSSGAGYSHTVDISIPDGQITIAAAFDDGKLTLDLTSGGETVHCEASLTISSDGFTLSDMLFDSGIQSIDLPLTISYTSGGSVPEPSSRVNIFEMSEEDLQAFVTTIAML